MPIECGAGGPGTDLAGSPDGLFWAKRSWKIDGYMFEITISLYVRSTLWKLEWRYVTKLNYFSCKNGKVEQTVPILTRL